MKKPFPAKKQDRVMRACRSIDSVIFCAGLPAEEERRLADYLRDFEAAFIAVVDGYRLGRPVVWP